MSILSVDRRTVIAGLTVGVAGIRSAIEGTGFVSSAAAQEAPEGGRLTLHAIDTYSGNTRPGLRIDLSLLEEDAFRLLKTVSTVEGGRTEAPVLEADALQVGRYELLLHLDEYFEALGADLPEPPFLGKVPIRFGVFDAGQRFHVPILFNPWNYSYYRGS